MTELNIAPSYFEVYCKSDEATFIIELIDPVKIAFARNIVAGIEKSRVSVSGEIIKKTEWYNPQWSYHLAPASIDFFEFAIEVCDATPSFVQEHLDEVGGAFLPDNRWCPWCSVVVKEVTLPKSAY